MIASARRAALVAALLGSMAVPALAGEAQAGPTALDAIFAGVVEDGPLELNDAVRDQIIKILPAAGRGQQCEKPGEVEKAAVAVKDRGHGALLVVLVQSCNGEVAYAFGPGTPVRVAKLYDSEDGRKLVSAVSLALRGGDNSAEEIGLVLSGPTNELRLFVRRSERGFAFAPSGTLPDFAFASHCDDGDQDHVAGYQSMLRVGETRRLQRLRLEQRCGGGYSSLRCEIWNLDQGVLTRRGSCALPVKLDEAELRKAGWK